MPNPLSRLTQQLKEVTDQLRDEQYRSKKELAAYQQRIDGVYNERNMCVSLIAKLAMKQGYKVGLGKHVGENWEDDWRNIVFIDLPSGQISWHIHDSEMYLFDDLPPYDGVWDGHSTSVKYNRVLNPEL